MPKSSREPHETTGVERAVPWIGCYQGIQRSDFLEGVASSFLSLVQFEFGILTKHWALAVYFDFETFSLLIFREESKKIGHMV